MIFIAANVGGFYVSYYRIRKRSTNDFRAVSTANQSYLIANGRVFSKGYVFKDFKKDFNVYSVNSPLVSYYSVDNSFVLTQVTQNSFQEVLCLKTSCATLVFNNKLYVFIWIIHLWEFVQTILPRNIVLSKTYPAQIIYLLFVHNNCIFVTTDNALYEIDLNFNVVCKQEINLSLNNMTNATSRSENSLRNNSTNYNTSSYNVSNNNSSNNNTSIPNTPGNNLPNNNTTNNYKAYNASSTSNSYKELVYNYNILKKRC